MAAYDFEHEAFERMLEAGLLPRPSTEEDARALRKVGVKLRGSGLLRDATLPEGWRVDHTEARRGQLIDPGGRVRANLFYKAGPVEFKGELQMSGRYTISYSSDDDGWYALDTALPHFLFCRLFIDNSSYRF